jgi:hypothetical protein
MKQLNLAAALAVSAIDLVLVCIFPLVGLAILPSLFGGVCWAAAALQAFSDSDAGAFQGRATRLRLTPAPGARERIFRLFKSAVHHHDW